MKKSLLVLIFAINAMAQSLEEIQNKVDVLASEIERIKQTEEVLPAKGKGQFGLAPAASKVYQQKKGVSLGGYGEMLYRNYDSKNQSDAASGLSDEFDYLRAVLYLGYRFDERFVFNSEIEFEHGSTNNNGSVSVEFAYLDYLYKNALNFRAGLLLTPMGFINELHEPTVFLSSQRPVVERQILPSTWREAGAGVFGQTKDITYRAYIMTGFDGVGGGSSGASGFSSSGLRGGRQNGSESLANDFAFVGRLDYSGIEHLDVGFSGYIGQSDQDQIAGVNALTAIYDIHADVDYKGIQARALVAQAFINDADLINAAQGNVGTGVAKELLGYYVELAYNVLHEFNVGQSLSPFFRYEHLNTQQSLVTGFGKDASKDRQVFTFGLNFKPIEQIVLKGDYEWHRNEAKTGVNQFNFLLGYMF